MHTHVSCLLIFHANVIFALHNAVLPNNVSRLCLLTQQKVSEIELMTIGMEIVYLTVTVS